MLVFVLPPQNPRRQAYQVSGEKEIAGTPEVGWRDIIYLFVDRVFVPIPTDEGNCLTRRIKFTTDSAESLNV